MLLYTYSIHSTAETDNTHKPKELNLETGDLAANY